MVSELYSNLTFRIDSNQKKIDQNFLTLSFFTLLGLLAEKRLSPTKKITREKIFDFEIFILKYVSNRSESIPTKNIFRSKFFACHFFHYFSHFGRKTTESQEKIHGKELWISNFCNFWSKIVFIKNVFHSHFILFFLIF